MSDTCSMWNYTYVIFGILSGRLGIILVQVLKNRKVPLNSPFNLLNSSPFSLLSFHLDISDNVSKLKEVLSKAKDLEKMILSFSLLAFVI